MTNHLKTDGINQPRFFLIIIEDNPDDRFLLFEAFRYAGLEGSLLIFSKGDEAVHFLENVAHTGRAGFLILLDLNLPGMHGFEVLRFIKSSKKHGTIPVVVFTTSEASEEVELSYQLGANAFLVKPIDFSELIQTVHSLWDFWFRYARLPVQRGGRTELGIAVT